MNVCCVRVCRGQSHNAVSINHSFYSERRTEAEPNRCPSAHQPNASPLGQNRLTARSKSKARVHLNWKLTGDIDDTSHCRCTWPRFMQSKTCHLCQLPRRLASRSNLNHSHCSLFARAILLVGDRWTAELSQMMRNPTHSTKGDRQSREISVDKSCTLTWGQLERVNKFISAD